MKLVIALFAFFFVVFTTENKSEENERVSVDDLDLPEDPSHGKDYPCNQKCGSGFFHATGKCNTKTGRCECMYGYTGPNSKYVNQSHAPNQIIADHCREPCRYTRDYRNEKCVYQQNFDGDENNKTVTNHEFNEDNCHWKCGYGQYQVAGKCIGQNRCLCMWSWTGNGAIYVKNGFYKGRIIANYCTKACNYKQDYRNPKCGYYHGNIQYSSRNNTDDDDFISGDWPL